MLEVLLLELCKTCETASQNIKQDTNCYYWCVCMCVGSVVSDSVQPPWSVTCRLFCSWKFPGKNTGVGCHFPCQRIFTNQGTNLHLLCLLPCRQTLYHLSHQGSHAHHNILWLTANVRWMNKQMNKLINEEFCKENDPTLAKLQCIHEQSYLSLRLFISIK